MRKARNEADAGEREKDRGWMVQMGWERRQRRDTRDGEEKMNEREHCFALARPSTTAGPSPSRLNAVKLSSYSHKGNSLSQPVKYKRVFPAGRFSTPIVFWAGLLFSVALRRAAQSCRLLFPLTTTLVRYYYC